MTCLGLGYEEWSGSDWCNLHISGSEYVLVQCITLFMVLSFPLSLLHAWRWFEIRAFIRLLRVFTKVHTNIFLSNFSRSPTQAFTLPFLICCCQVCAVALRAMERHDITWLGPHVREHSGGTQLSSSAQNPQMPVVLAPRGLCWMRWHSHTSAAVWHHPAKTGSCGEIVSGAAGINPLCFPPSLTPQQNSLWFSASLFWGCWHTAAMEQGTCRPFPLTRLLGDHRRMLGWVFLGSPEPAGSRFPSSLVSQWRQWDAVASHQAERVLPWESRFLEERELPYLCTPQHQSQVGCGRGGQHWMEVIATNHLHAKKEKKDSSVSLTQSSKSSIRLLSGICFVPFKKHSLMRMKYEGSRRSQILC